MRLEALIPAGGIGGGEPGEHENKEDLKVYERYDCQCVYDRRKH